jgi:hypothetical protein
MFTYPPPSHARNKGQKRYYSKGQKHFLPPKNYKISPLAATKVAAGFKIFQTLDPKIWLTSQGYSFIIRHYASGKRIARTIFENLAAMALKASYRLNPTPIST